MAIERLSFPCYLNIKAGIEIYPAELNSQLLRILRRFGRYSRRLEEGEYELTPSIWEKHLYRHTLTVLSSGFGLVRMIPRYKDSSTTVADENGMSELRKGGRVIHLPHDQISAAIIGPNRFYSNTVCLYEYVYFIPEPNPVNLRRN